MKIMKNPSINVILFFLTMYAGFFLAILFFYYGFTKNQDLLRTIISISGMIIMGAGVLTLGKINCSKMMVAIGSIFLYSPIIAFVFNEVNITLIFCLLMLPPLVWLMIFVFGHKKAE